MSFFNFQPQLEMEICSFVLILPFFQEEKKILFYHPSDVEKNEKIRNVGLCEAIVQFTR